MKNKITWIFALFIFVYSGAEGNQTCPLHTRFPAHLFHGPIANIFECTVSLGGWIVVFMTRVRNASSFVGGAAATGFWGGMTVGRLFLPFLTMRIGEFRSMILYLSLVIILELIFWLVPNLVLSAVSAAFLGMFMGTPLLHPPSHILLTHPRSNVPYRHSRYNKTTAPLSPCRHYRIRNFIWWLGRSYLPLHCGRPRASQGRQNPPTIYTRPLRRAHSPMDSIASYPAKNR